MRNLTLGVCVAALLTAGAARAEDTVKLGYIDPLSGGGASIGEVGLKHFQWLADQINASGGLMGKKLEILPFDDKVNPQEAVVQARKAIDAGARFITQGNGSSVASALIDFVQKFNDRNPGKETLYFNYAAVDTSLTNAKCSFWHFRWDANSTIKMAAITNYLKTQPSVKKVYIINQDYSFGQEVKKLANEMLKAKRPDVQIVGDELHPLLKVTDFAPYIAKIKASGADTVITGNWGQDMALLLKAAADAGLQVKWYTYYAGGAGGPTAIKQTGLDHKVFDVVEGNPNSAPPDAQKTEEEFRAKFNVTLWYPRAVNEMRMFQKAVTEAKSLDPKAVALKLEDMKVKTFDGGEGWMRKEDHQFHQDMYIRSFGALPKGAKFDEEKTGWGWTEVAKVAAKDTVVPTTCKMERP
ncbi:MAG: branched-chain amino acid ABC transporter substrate-binding protein [Methylobacteriaceae bacterium]|nr:branched-chain amino acid ABC transporter substrate-binding protein [Rhodoblastus sp.]MCC0003946.1 branched-chain amino acid ABC transporter substrate-binding protein [Methylobacteriaceae bacterium]